MRINSPFVIVLSQLEISVLTARARSGRGPHRDVIRARIVLAAAAGRPNAATATDLGISVDTVRKWRRRFATDGISGLEDLPRSGRPRRFTPVQVAQVKALACTLPAETGLPLSRQQQPDELGHPHGGGPPAMFLAQRREHLGSAAVSPAGARSDPPAAAPGVTTPRVRRGDGLDAQVVTPALQRGEEVVGVAEPLPFPQTKPGPDRSRTGRPTPAPPSRSPAHAR